MTDTTTFSTRVGPKQPPTAREVARPIGIGIGLGAAAVIARSRMQS